MCDQLSARPDVNWAAGVGHTGLLDLMFFLGTSSDLLGWEAVPGMIALIFIFLEVWLWTKNGTGHLLLEAEGRPREKLQLVSVLLWIFNVFPKVMC